MPVNQQYAQSLVGQWVDCHTAMGVHTGILREVRPDGIVLAMPRRTVAGQVNGQKMTREIVTADKPNDPNNMNVFFNPFFFSPFFFPFFSIFALRRRRFFI
jgi:hypothetical protein